MTKSPKQLIVAFSLICIVLATIPAQAQRAVPLSVRQYLEERTFLVSDHDGRYFPSRIIDGREMVDAFVAVDGSSASISKLEAAGVIINCCFDGFVTAQIPVDKLLAVSLMPCVTDVEISRRMILCTDSTLSVTHAGQVLDGTNNGLPQSFDGTGVIVGIFDVGYDYQHVAFRRSDDPTVSRIVRVYSTTDRSGHPARFNKTIRIPGSVFMGDEIYALTTDSRSDTHGTHTASIAAGTHVGGYGGMAPGADLVLCALSVLDGTISATEIANCMRYVDSYADSVGKPCVMSMSISAFGGSHDGKDYLSTVANQLLGPGRFFVFAAGNNGKVNTYSGGQATEKEPFNLMLTYNNTTSADSTYNYRLCMADIWLRTPSLKVNYRYHFLDQTTGKIVWESDVYSGTSYIDVSAFSDYFSYNSSIDTTGYLKGQVTYSPYNRKYELSLTLRNLYNNDYTTRSGVKYGRYAIGISIWAPGGESTWIDAWTSNSGTGFSSGPAVVTTIDGKVYSGFYSGATNACTINSHAVCDSIISAGAYVSRNSYYSLFRGTTITDRTLTVGDIASFSSYEAAGTGPTGKALPTICAPGCYVISAVSRYSSYASSSAMTVMRTDSGDYWGAMSGTSMATPTVAGILAQWLQVKPDLSIAEAKEIMALTAIKDQFTQGVNADHFGPNGKIDALAGIKLLLLRMGLALGDVNGDGHINMADVVELIDYLISGDMTGYQFNEVAADFNQDGKINIADVVEIIDYILRRP